MPLRRPPDRVRPGARLRLPARGLRGGLRGRYRPRTAGPLPGRLLRRRSRRHHGNDTPPAHAGPSPSSATRSGRARSRSGGCTLAGRAHDRRLRHRHRWGVPGPGGATFETSRAGAQCHGPEQPDRQRRLPEGCPGGRRPGTAAAREARPGLRQRGLPRRPHHRPRGRLPQRVHQGRGARRSRSATARSSTARR